MHQITVIVALLPGPAHPPKVKYQDFCQNNCTTSDTNSEGHPQCHQDPQNIIKAPTPGASHVKGAPYLSQTWLNQGQQCRGPSQALPQQF